MRDFLTYRPDLIEYVLDEITDEFWLHELFLTNLCEDAAYENGMLANDRWDPIVVKDEEPIVVENNKPIVIDDVELIVIDYDD